MDLYNRVRGAIERINVEQAGKDVIAVAHGGTIKAAIGLALGDQPKKCLAFDIDNCSVTRLDHLASARPEQLASADGQPAAMDRGCLAQRRCISRRGRRWFRRPSWRDRAASRCRNLQRLLKP